MKKAVNRWIFAQTRPLNECFAVAKKAGFEGVEINFTNEGADLSPKTTRADTDKILSQARDAGIKVCSVCACWVQLGSPDPDERKKGVEYAAKALEVTSWLGADTVLLVPATVSEDVAYDAAYDRAKQGLIEIGAAAEKFKVFLGVENVWNKFLLSPLEMKRFIEEINKPYIKAYFDVGNVLVNGFPEQWIRILGKHIKKIHLKDFRNSTGNITGFVNLLEGDVNWPLVIQALKEVGYDDYLVVETGPYRFHPDSILNHVSLSVDKILGR